MLFVSGFVLSFVFACLLLPVLHCFFLFFFLPFLFQTDNRALHAGYLFFLSTGIFFGFKKPLAFFALEDIESVSYTSILQRTFNLNISVVKKGKQGTDEIQEYEFAMIELVNHPGIDDYIKRHGLQDASMAEKRRAKKASGNSEKASGDGETEAGIKAGGETNAVTGAEESELGKAQRQIEEQKGGEEEEDDEDEDEEDYEPPSDDDSGGSGSSSSEEEDEQEEGQEASRDKQDLVAEELGSEAEEVEEEEEEEEKKR